MLGLHLLLLYSLSVVSLAPSRRRRKSPLAATILRIQDQACSLHEILTLGWQCNCQSSHNTYLQLEKRIVDPKDRSEKTLKAKIRFMVLFYFGANQDNTESLPWNWQKAEVRLVSEDTDHFETQ